MIETAGMYSELQVKLDCRFEKDGPGYRVVLTHPDLQGELQCYAHSIKLLDLQLKAIDIQVPVRNAPTDPFQVLMESADKLVEGIRDLKETFKS